MSKVKSIIVFFLCVLVSYNFYSQTNEAPVVFAEGNQPFCPGTDIKIVTDFTLTDVDDTTIDSFFIQISEGYQVNFDKLELRGVHSNINSSWSNSEGKLTLESSISGAEILLTDVENAVKDIVFTTSATNVTSKKSFSLSIGDANYLPSTGHFYEFISEVGITWKDAKTAAENRFYYGRKGYLATLTSKEEADFAGKQASGAGWIGGSDEETENVWKWVTGPEAGTIFWNGSINGSTPNFAFWNNDEPNNSGGNEDYAHITDASIGINGSWNDLPNAGGSGAYVPKGYIVEYGTPSDPDLNIVATASIYVPKIESITNETICEKGSVTISAIASDGKILWYDADTGGTLLYEGSEYTTLEIDATTTYYATILLNGCEIQERTPVEVVVNQKPTITNFTEDLICFGSATLSASASAGQINWYDSETSLTPIFTGNTFRTPFLNITTSYFVEANIDNCISVSRTEVRAIVDNTIPEFELDTNLYVLCADTGSVTLETKNPLGNYTYIWKKNGIPISGNTSSKLISESGTYTVQAISDAGCESLEETITVIDSEKATITADDVIIIDNSTNNSIEVINDLGIGEYEFSLDDEFGMYKNQGFFENISAGKHTLYIKDKNGCGTAHFEFSILVYPRFFTPNGDGENDIWKIEGFNDDLFTASEVYIYNRFGKLLHQIDVISLGWDGSFQGKILPSNTYWFKVVLTDINDMKIVKKGSFSLIRK